MSEADRLQKEIFGQNQTHNLFKNQIRNNQNKLHMECKEHGHLQMCGRALPGSLHHGHNCWHLEDAVAEVNLSLSSLRSWCALSP